MVVLNNTEISLGIDVSCPVSPSTVQIVDYCPDNEEKWRQAAERKNCAAYASQCDEPKRLVYHCVINEYANMILEVCAYGKIIVLGHCTEYNLDVNRIQQNFRTNCSKFRPNPCPRWYHSQEAYKYQGCYKLTTKITQEPVTDHDQVTLPNSEINSTGPAATDTPNKHIIVVFVLTIVVLVAVVIATVIIIRNRVKKKAADIRNRHEKGKFLDKESSLKVEEIVKVKVKDGQDYEIDELLGESVSLRMGEIKNRGKQDSTTEGFSTLITSDDIH